MSHVLKTVITLAGGSIAAAFAIGVSMSAGWTQAAMPAPEWRSMLDQHVVLVPHREQRMQRPTGTVTALVGEGWG